MPAFLHRTRHTVQTPAWIAGAVLVIAFAALYLLTLDDGLRPEELAGGDLITHQYAQVQGRPSNAPGYPLYTMGGWLWFRAGRVLLGASHNPIPILSSYSTLWALIALALLYALILECLGTRRWPLALVVTAFYGLTYFFWYYAVTTEQYTSSVAWTLAACLLAFKWERSQGHPERVDNSTSQMTGRHSQGHPERVDSSSRKTANDQSKDAATAPHTRILRLRASLRDAPPLRMLTHQKGAPASRDDRYLLTLAFLAGVGLAHQVTVLFAVPPLLWFVLSREPGLLRRPRLIAAALALALLPLLSYAYVYLRGSQYPEWRGVGQWASNWQWFISFLSTGQGRSELTWAWQPFFTSEFPALMWREMTWPGLVLGLVGLVALPRRRAITLYGITALYLVFCWIDRLGNWFQVIMPVYALLAVGIAAAAGWLWERAGAFRVPVPSTGGLSSSTLGRRPAQDDLLEDHPLSILSGTEPPGSMGGAVQSKDASRNDHPLSILSGTEPPGSMGGAVQPKKAPHPWSRAVIRTAILLALVALAVYRGALSYPRADARGRAEDVGLAPAWAILADDPPPNTAIFGTQAEALALSYVTGIWRQRPDLRPVTSEQARGLLPTAGFAATEAALPLVPLEISPEARYSALGRTLVEVTSEGRFGIEEGSRTERWAPWEHAFGGQVRLVGGRWDVNPATGETVVLLAWQALPALEGDWAVSVRLARAGAELAQVDQAHPVFGAYPMSRWQPGETVLDAYPFRLPAEAAPDTLVVILYRATANGFENLDVFRHALRE